MTRIALITVSAVVLLAGSSASAGDLPLSFYNGGPSSGSVPGTDNANVATLRFPRAIVNPGVPFALPGNLNNNALSVQTQGDETTGVRWRSVATIAFYDTNPNAFFLIAANVNFNPTAAGSYILFLHSADAQQISTFGELAAFRGSVGAQFVQYDLDNTSIGLTDGDLTAADLNTGVAISASSVLHAFPDAGTPSLMNPGAAGVFDTAIVVLANGGTEIATEWIAVRNSPSLVAPIGANFVIDAQTIRVVANDQLVDDDAQNPADTDPAALTGTDFRVRINGAGPAIQLADFLSNTLDEARSVAGVSVGGAFRDTINISLNQPVTNLDDRSLILSSLIGFQAGPTGGGVFSHAGEFANGNLSTYRLMGLADGCPAFANADTNGDGVVNFADLNAVLSSFGQSGAPMGDVNFDGVVNFADLNAVLSAFGTVCD